LDSVIRLEQHAKVDDVEKYFGSRFAACLKNQGYATGQFGKNHLGDLNHMLPTNHGFDEFFGNPSSPGKASIAPAFPMSGSRARRSACRRSS
jgi:hypothetical protein